MNFGFRVVLVVGLATDTVDEDLSNYFAKYAEVLSVQIKRDPATGNSCSYAMVQFIGRQSGFSIVTVINQKHEIKPGYWVTALSSTYMAPIQYKEEDDNVAIEACGGKVETSTVLRTGSDTIYVAGFCPMIEEVDEDILYGHFKGYGTVKAIELPRCHGEDYPPSSYGWALVQFTCNADAEYAVEHHPHIITGVTVRVHLTDGRLPPKEIIESEKVIVYGIYDPIISGINNHDEDEGGITFLSKKRKTDKVEEVEEVQAGT